MDRTPPSKIPFASLLAANTISAVGNTLTMLAIPWFVLQTTGSAAKTGISGFFTVLPAALSAFFGGGLVDRLGFRRTSILSDVASGVAVALVPVLYAYGLLHFWALLACVFAGALLDAPGATARESLIPLAAERAGIRLERANALFQSAHRFSSLVGPPLAALLIVALGASNVLWVDAATFAVSAIVVRLGVERDARAKATGESYLERMRTGLRFLRDDRLILTITATIAVTNFLDTPIFAVVLPVYSSQQFGSAGPLGLAIGCFGAGALAGGLLYGAIGHRASRRALLLGGFATIGLSIWLLALLPSLATMLGSLAVIGLAAGPINPILMTIFQERVPREIYGRVLGTIVAIALSAAPFGILVVGYAIEWFGLEATLLTMACGYAIVSAGMLVSRTWRSVGLHCFAL
jgi:MFS family permease